jgi:hypothetical protein
MKEAVREVFSVKIVNVRKSRFWTSVSRPAVKKVKIDLFLTRAEKVAAIHVKYLIYSSYPICSNLMCPQCVSVLRVHIDVLVNAEKVS